MERLMLCLFAFFAVAQSKDGSTLIPRGVLEIGDVRYEYGMDTADPKGGNGYLTIRDGDITRWVVFDEGAKEEVVYVADLGINRIGVVIECYIKDSDSNGFKRKNSLIKLIDRWGNQLISTSMTKEIIGIGNYDYLIAIETSQKIEYYDHELWKHDFVSPDGEYIDTFSYQHQGVAYVNGIQVEKIDLDYPGYYDIRIEGKNHLFQYAIVLHSDPESLPLSGSSTEKVMISTKGDLFLNGEPITSGTLVSEPGNYDLVVAGANGYRLNRLFTIDAVIDNVDNGQSLMPPLKIKASGSDQTLNGKPYHGEDVYDAGTYLFAVHGQGDYLLERSFTILPVVEGVANDETYLEKVNINLNCYALLNGEAIPKNYLIDKPGSYVLVLYLNDMPYETIAFTVTAPSETEEANWFLDNIWLFVFAAMGALGLALIFKKR
ncbi:MAG: hypothetical protein ACOX16_00190 [Candidatus Izemoplasmatales bacterium]|jgi:hypothetical protein